MKTCIVSYSMTNNNEKLSKAISKEIAAEHIIIKEPKERKIPKIILDLLLKKTPRILNNHKEVLNCTRYPIKPES